MTGRVSISRWIGRLGAAALISLALLTGCAYPALINKSSPTTTVIPVSPTKSPFPPVPTTAVSAPILPTHTPEPTPNYVSSLTPLPTATSPGGVPAQYDLDLILDYAQHSFSLNERVRYINLSADSLSNFTLVVEPNLNPGGFDLLSLTWENGNNIESYTLENNQLQFTLPQLLHPGEELLITISYRADIPQLTDYSYGYRPVAYGYSSAQTNLVDWYAYVPPYITGEGWLVHPPWGLGEYQVYGVADFKVNLTLAEPVPGLVFAAPAAAQRQGDIYSYQLLAARTFALSASPEYIVQTWTVGGVTINSYSFPYDKYAGQEVLYSTADAVQLYSQLLLPYPHATLSVVEADFLDGMEYDGLFFLSHGFYDLYDGTPRGYLTFIAAHETAHQWWYGLVGNDQALEPWLDEGLCTYMERVFYEQLYSDSPHHLGESMVDWWWYFRVNYYDPSGWVDSGIYNFSDYRLYRNAVYLNGAKFLEDLRDLIGDPAFFAFLKDYTNENIYRIATAGDFFASLRRHTSVNLDELLASYFQSVK